MTTTPKRKSIVREVYEHVQSLIINGKYDSNGRLPTEDQLRRRFNTSRSTVIKAMKELELLGIISRRAGSGSFVNQACTSKCTFAAILIAGLGDIEFFSPIGAQIAYACQKHNISLIWGAAGPTTEIATPSDIDLVCRRLKDQQVTGVFFVPDQFSCGKKEDGGNMDIYLTRKLDEFGIAIVLIDRDLTHYPERSAYDFVGVDNLDAAFQQTTHLYEQNCRKIIHVTRPGTLTTKEARIAGYRTAMRHLRLPVKTELIYSGDPSDPEFVKSTLATNPDGVTCFNDPVASQYLQTLLALGVRIPEEIKVIGLDDLEYAKFLPVPLTTMRQPRRDIGEVAVETFIRRLNNRLLPPTQSLLTTSLIIRESTRNFDEKIAKIKDG